MSRGNLSVDGAAARIGIRPPTLRRWLREGRLAYIKAGRRVVLDPDDVDAFLRAHRVPARAEDGK